MIFAPNDADGWPNDSLLSGVQVELLRSEALSLNQKLSNQLRERKPALLRQEPL